MKKYIYLAAILTIVSLTIYGQNDTRIEDKIRNSCPIHELDFGTYFDEHRALTENSYDTILTKLNMVSNCKDIQVCREKRLALDAWFTLMRIQDIEWTTHKADILIHLKNWVEQILNGNSYLNQSNKNILYNTNGCPFVSGDPISLPSACYAVILKLDTKYAIKTIDNTWGLIIKDEPFNNRLRNGILNLININYKNTDIQLLLEKLEKTNISKTDIQKIQEIKLKYALSQSKNQAEAWEKIVLFGRSDTAKMSPIESKEIWDKKFDMLEKVFGYGLEADAPLVAVEKEKDSDVKYWLAYMSCYIENANYPNKSNDTTIKRIDKLVNDVKNQGLGSKEGKDYLDEAYQIFKKWH